MNELQHFVSQIDPEFTRANNRLSLANTGGFSEQVFGNTTAFRDVNKPKSTYYNRVVGYGEQDIPWLPEIESLYKQTAIDCVVSLAPQNQTQKVLADLRVRT